MASAEKHKSTRLRLHQTTISQFAKVVTHVFEKVGFSPWKPNGCVAQAIMEEVVE